MIFLDEDTELRPRHYQICVGWATKLVVGTRLDPGTGPDHDWAVLGLEYLLSRFLHILTLLIFW
jgi:hypothetical protein